MSWLKQLPVGACEALRYQGGRVFALKGGIWRDLGGGFDLEMVREYCEVLGVTLEPAWVSPPVSAFHRRNGGAK